MLHKGRLNLSDRNLWIHKPSRSLLVFLIKKIITEHILGCLSQYVLEVTHFHWTTVESESCFINKLHHCAAIICPSCTCVGCSYQRILLTAEYRRTLWGNVALIALWCEEKSSRNRNLMAARVWVGVCPPNIDSPHQCSERLKVHRFFSRLWDGLKTAAGFMHTEQGLGWRLHGTDSDYLLNEHQNKASIQPGFIQSNRPAGWTALNEQRWNGFSRQ